jgi:flagellar biosynthesis regulator FlaF
MLNNAHANTESTSMRRLRDRAFGTLTLTIALASTAYAAPESRLAQQALHCSAIFSVFAESLGDDAKRLKEFKRGVEIFTELYVKEAAGDPAAAQRDAEQRRTALLTEFQQQLAQREPYLREDGVVCGAWAEGFFAQGDQWSFIPVYPKVIGISARQKYTPIGAEAFSRWRR